MVERTDIRRRKLVTGSAFETTKPSGGVPERPPTGAKPWRVSRMTDFSSRLAAAVAETGAPLCVGLDPDPARLPSPFGATPQDAASFCIEIVAACQEAAAAFKPNLAFFEAWGAEGWRALERVAGAVRQSGRLLVLDGKRGDIGNTGRRYAASQFDALGADAVTVAPYMGADSLTPFLAHRGRCAFVLVATSNPGADDLQRRLLGDAPLYRAVADLAAETAEREPGEVGFVVGGTRPAVLAALRDAHPDVPFLVPGVGAQGGTAEGVVRCNNGGPMLVNSSRAVLYASPGADFADAAREAAAALAADLGAARVP